MPNRTHSTYSIGIYSGFYRFWAANGRIVQEIASIKDEEISMIGDFYAIFPSDGTLHR
jgi:hypothetical protein